MENIIEKQTKAYLEAFNINGPTPKGTFQNNIETQYLRFERLIEFLKSDLQDSSVHDIGSGICDLHDYLLKQNVSHRYSGTEIVQEMIDFSLLKYPDIKLYNRDFLQIENEKYDFVFLSGTLNLKLNTSENEWLDYSMEMIKKMFKHSKKAISFNCLTSYNTFSQDNLMYFDPKYVLDYCITNLSRFVNIDECYPLFEFTVTVFHEEYIAQKFRDKAFDRYLKK